MEKAVWKLRRLGGRLTDHIDRIPMKRMAVYAGILLAVSLIPLLVLGRYNVMCVDDYDYGRVVHDTWLSTGSLWQSVQSAWQQNMEIYKEWQGTYVSCFLMAVCPMNFSYEAAWIVPVIMIGMSAVSSFVLGSHVLRKWLGADQASSSFVMFIMLFMFYQVMEEPFEGIYWYNGATHYMLMESIWFFALAAVSASLWAEKKSREIFFCVIAVILSLIVGGGNLVTGLQAEIMMVFLVLYTLAANRKKILPTAIPLITGTIGFLVNTLAPGNALRDELDTDVGYSAVMSVLLSFYNAVVYMIRWTPAFVIVIWLLLLPVLWKVMKRSDRKFGHPVLVTAGAFCVLSAMFTPTLYAIGMAGLARVDNIIQMVYYLELIPVTAYWLGYFAHRQSAKADVWPQDMEDGISRYETCAGEAFGLFLEKTKGRMTAVCLVIVLVMLVFTADKNTYSSVSALRSLYYKEAQTFYTEAMERHEIYVDETIRDAEVKPYSARPALFDFNDLEEDAANWLNQAVTKYYHKDSVRVVPEE